MISFVLFPFSRPPYEIETGQVQIYFNLFYRSICYILLTWTR